MRNFTYYLISLLLVITSNSILQAQTPAFPGAEGAGMYTTGGRGTPGTPTTVFEVTNLNDDNNPGSLRYALQATAAYRTIVFRVSGTIHLNSKLNIRDNTTIAGQTAPGDGICTADYPVVISGNNVIVRYMRFRMGDKNQNKGMIDGSGGDDSFGGTGISNVIVDHCSVSWSDDECLTIYRGDNLTIQWCFITEPLNYSYHFETGDTDYEQHGYGGIWGAKRGTMHHNLFADCRNRNPRFAGISTYSPDTVGVENVDLRNNIIYNWGINTVYAGEGGNYNVVNNYYKWGPNTSSGVKFRICNPGNTTTIPYGKWYVDGNYVDGSPTNTANNWSGVVMSSNVAADTVLSKVTTPFDLGYPVTTQLATDVYESVLQNAGAILPRRDTLDQRIVNDVRNRTGRIIDVQGGYPHGTAYSLTVNAWPTLNSTTPPTDTDNDGMPDDWETSHGLNPNDASDRNIYDASGYTMLEDYLNDVSNISTAPVIAVGGTMASFSQTAGSPSGSQTYTVAGYNLTNNLTITPPANFELSLDGSTWNGPSNPIVLTPASGTIASTTIMVRLNASSVGTYSGNITHVSSGATSVNVAVTGSNTALAKGLGSYADIDGGYEHQTEGSYTTATSHTSTTQWEASAAFNIVSSGARTGSKYLHFNASSSSNKYIFSPVLTNTPLASGTSYIIQFWYRVPSALSSTTSLSGWASLSGGLGGSGTGISTSSVTATLNSSTTPGVWQFYSGVITTASATVTSSFAGMKVATPASPFFDIDDYVVYAATTADVTPPDAPASATSVTNANDKTIAVSWTAPSTGVDGGGYVVVRSTSSTSPVPNLNGVYITGNNMGSGYTVVYIGAGTSFTDTDSTLAAGTQYYYYIFTADKAYNYSAATTANVTTNTPGGTLPSNIRAVVAKDGSGNFTTVQAAINAAPTGQTAPYKIYIKKGKYVETVSIPSGKPFIQLVGENMAETIISYDNYSGKANPAGGTYGTSTCGTLIINAADIMLMNLSVENSTGYGIDANAAVPAPGDGPQAVAVYTTSDRVVFYNCRFNGGQDTYYGGNNKGTRCYFKNCYIDGNTDFMFGSSTIIFDTCIIYPRTRLDNGTGGYLTAVNTKAESAYGYVFRDCKITKNRGFTLYTMGRPWQNDASTTDAAKSHNKVVFLNTTMGSTVKPEGWSTWDAGTNTSYITYGEYNSKNYDGTPVNVSSRVSWSKQLSATDAAAYYNNDTVFVNANTPAMATWNPYAVWSDLSTTFKPELSVSNLIAKKSTTTTSLTWNVTWPMTGITCALYRSNDKINFTQVSSQVSTEDSACNFSFSENVPPPGQTYYYIVRASKTGFTSTTSDTAFVVSTPTIAVSGTLGSFLQGAGAPSASQTYVVSGTNLTNNITITPPAGYEVSSDSNTWYNSSTSLVLTQTGGVVSSTNISVRLNGTTAGSYNGNIVNASTGAASVNVPVTGTIQTDSLHAGIVLVQWPLSTDNTDSASVRASGIIGTTPVFKNLVLSNGSVANTPTAYSTVHGQAYGATPDGYWTTAMGGPGGTLNRNFYEQFIVTADTTRKLRIDSIFLSTAFFNTSSNTKLAVVYSVSNFRNDSTEIKVVAKNGIGVTASTSGNFANAFDVSNQSTATTDLFTMLVNGSAGVALNPGDTFAFRIYHCTGSTNAGRYAQLKNVVVKGASIANVVAGPPVVLLLPSANVPVTASDTKYAIGPNPAHDYVSVYHSKLYTTATINIYNMNGNLVGSYGSKPATNHTTINISGLPSGMYFIELRRLNDRVLLRFIKQ